LKYHQAVIPRISAVVALALAGGACGNQQAGAPAEGSSSTAAGSGSAAAANSRSAVIAGSGSSGSAVAAPAVSAAAKIDDAALDAAITAKGLDPHAVRQRAVLPHSAWAVIQAPRNADLKVVELDLVRVRADGAAVLKLTPPQHAAPTWWNTDIDPFNVRDLDGDGHDDCLLVLQWLQDVPHGPGEVAKQLYVIADGAPPKVAFTTIIDYATASDDSDAGGGKKPARPEHVAYDWKVAGTPPILSLKRTESTLNRKRAHGLLDPAADPLMSASDGKDIPLSLK
jgi:hypothetical protein